jgi:hypothetical protein
MLSAREGLRDRWAPLVKAASSSWTHLGLGAAALILALLYALFLGKPGDGRLWPVPPGDAAVTVWVVDNGFHSNLVVETARLRSSAGATARAMAAVPAGPWTQVGWGDARFYVETGSGPRRALDGLRSLFAPRNASAVMLEPLSARPDRYWKTGVTPVRLSEEGFRRLVARVDRSFRTDGAGKVQLYARRDGARFFRSVETFSIMHLCNHWTAELLHEAGLPVRPVMDTVGAGLALDLKLSRAARR